MLNNSDIHNILSLVVGSSSVSPPSRGVETSEEFVQRLLLLADGSPQGGRGRLLHGGRGARGRFPLLGGGEGGGGLGSSVEEFPSTATQAVILLRQAVSLGRGEGW